MSYYEEINKLDKLIEEVEKMDENTVVLTKEVFDLLMKAVNHALQNGFAYSQEENDKVNEGIPH